MSEVQSPLLQREEAAAATLVVSRKGPAKAARVLAPPMPATTPGEAMLEQLLLLTRTDASMSNLGAGASPMLPAEMKGKPKLYLMEGTLPVPPVSVGPELIQECMCIGMEEGSGR